MSRSLRLFVAAYPPADAATRWLDAARNLLPGSARLTPPEQVHLTLVFLGDRDERELPDIRESVARSVAGFAPAPCRAVELRTLPEKGDPRLLAAMLEVHSSLLEIQRRLAQRLASARSRKEAFLPHATVARFTSGSTRPALVPLSDEPFPISEIRLMRSRLLPGGAEHLADRVFRLHPA